MNAVMKPGDVLLYSSSTWIGWLIKTLDGSEFSHAGIYLGSDQVGEALMAGNPGVHANPISTSFDKSTFVDAYRLASNPPELSPVLDVAHQTIAEGNRYAYAEILLVAMICTTRNLDFMDPALRRVVLATLSKANDWIESMFDQGREPMICSEFVFRCYDEALPHDDDPFALAILSQQSMTPTKRFRPFRRRERLGDHATPPTLHPKSLLGKILNDPDCETILHAKPAFHERFVAPPSDEDLDAIIESYHDSKSHRTVGLESTANVAPVSLDELKTEAAVFAQHWIQSRTNVTLESVPSSRSDTEKLQEVIADFVTPGDLSKSPSLHRIGRVYGDGV